MASRLPINPTEPVGEQLKNRRQALKLSLAQVELETKIRGKYLTALERCDYEALPNDVYGRGFVQHYANHLGMDGQLVAAAYTAERGGIAEAATTRPVLVQPRRLVFTGRIALVVLGLIIIVGILGYLAWQFSALAAAPVLDVTSPDSDRTLTGSTLTVTGTTTPGSEIEINGSPVLVGNGGDFDQDIALQSGVNVIRITAISKLGKRTTVIRNIRARYPTVAAGASSLPATPIAGVAIAVTVHQTTAIAVVTDGTTAFSGIILAGRTVVYGGAGVSQITLTTGNAGATSVTVTNSIAADKQLSPLGANGEVRQNQIFSADTVIP